MQKSWTRRSLLSVGAVTLSGGAIALSGSGLARALSAGEPGTTPTGTDPFPVSLNTSTLRGHRLPFREVIDIATRAGYAGVEPWPDEMDRHVESGGSLEDIAKRLRDGGLKVTGAIAFFSWMVDDARERRKGFEEAKRRMEKLARIGCTHVAAPPAGDVEGVDLLRAAERYRDLLEVGDSFGVTPALEIWGAAKNLYRLGQCALVAIEARHPKACVLPDVFHLYKGGSGLGGVRLLGADSIAGFHLNDYPADPTRERIRDADRVYPGDGIAPLAQLCRDLKSIGYRGAVSVELFNPKYYAEDPLLVARTALEKTRAVFRKAFDG